MAKTLQKIIMLFSHLSLQIQINAKLESNTLIALFLAF